MIALAWIGVGALVFLTSAAYDWANSHYISANTSGTAAAASGWSGATAVMGLVGLLGILGLSQWLALPEVAGFMFGTYVARRQAIQKKARGA